MGVNDDRLTADHRIISNSSVTANCAAPMAQILDNAFGVEHIFMTTIHAYSNDQRLADVPADDLRRSRAAAQNIIPTDTNAARTVTQSVPHLEGKVSGMALKVPVSNGSLVDMVLSTRKPIDATAVNEVMRTAAATERYARYVDYSSDPIVSSDIRQSPYSCTFDSLATMALGQHMVKTIGWYDNGWGYAHRVVNLIEHLAQLPGGL